MSYRKIILILCLGIFLSSGRNATAQSSVTYNYISNATQTFTVPACVTQVTVQLWAGGGGSGEYYCDNNGYCAGGSGAYYTGVISGLTTGNVLTLYVPSGGAYTNFCGTGQQGGAGGWPGGGQGGDDNSFYEEYGGGGGGYAAIQISGTYYVVVGAGGGGGSYAFYDANGGGGGATTGGTGGDDYGPTQGGTGATISAGGTAQYNFNGCDGTPSLTGTAFQGGYGGGHGSCFSFEYGGGGGGGGYYGGGGGGDVFGGGGGGSSFPASTFSSGGITFTKTTNSQGTQGINAGKQIAPGSPPAGIGSGGYLSNGGNGAIIITYVALSLTPVVMNNDSCRGSNNGRARVIVNGGSAPYTYSWFPIGGTRDTATGLGSGTYTVTVISACGATATATVTITEPGIMGVLAVQTQSVTCNGGSNGIATANIGGGGAPFTYAWTPSGETTASATGLTAGTYSVTVHDGCGNSASAQTTIVQPAVLSAVTASVTANVKCFGGNTGSATVNSITGGGVPYTYAWTPSGGSLSTANNLTAGTYTITVSDACGASVSTSVTVTQPATAVSVTAAVVTNVSCHGGNNGSASSTPAGGTGAYTYLWTPSNKTTQNINTMTAGTYTVRVTDNNGCTATASVTITQPTTLTVSASVTTNDRCRGGNDGSASSVEGGGVLPYNYSWSTNPNQLTQNATGLTAGTYTITVTDNNGCTASASVTITQPNVLTVTTTVLENIPCNGGDTGIARANPSPGTAPYTYLWSDGNSQTTASATGLTAGTYTIVVTDNCGNTASATATITEPNVLTLSTSTTANVLCFGGNDGSAGSVTGGGTGPYSYNWTPSGGTLDTATGLIIGTYTLSVTDSHGCSTSSSTTITQPTLLVITASPTAEVLCNGQNNGSASSVTTGGVAPYTYSWSSGSTRFTASNLTAGTYTVNVTDNHGCTASASTTITQPNELTVVASVPQNVICNGYSTGSVTSVTAGGTTPYTYSWSVIGNTTASVTGLSAGTYTINVWDVQGCTATASTTITQPIALMVGAGTVLNPICNGDNKGMVVAYVSGGPAPYTYAWTPGGGNADTMSGLGIGTYSVLVTDIDGCTGTANTTVTQPSALAVQIDSVPDDGSCTGSAWVTVSGGVGPYKYVWESGGDTTFMLANQCKGYYCCRVTDANGCYDNVCMHISSYLGVDNLGTNSGKITVYPNPTNGQFTIMTSGGGASAVDIYNVLGEKVFTTGINAGKNGSAVIDISNQPAGIYVYRVMSKANGSLLGEGKIILQK